MADDIGDDGPQFFSALNLQKELSGSFPFSPKSALQREKSVDEANAQLDMIESSTGTSAAMSAVKKILTAQVDDINTQQVEIESPSRTLSQASTVPSSSDIAQFRLDETSVPQDMQNLLREKWETINEMLQHPHCYLCAVMRDGFATYFVDDERIVVRGIIWHKTTGFKPRQLDMSCGWGGDVRRPYAGGKLFVSPACGSSKITVAMEREGEMARAVASLEAAKFEGQKPMVMIIDGGLFSCKAYYLCRDFAVVKESFKPLSWDACPRFVRTADFRQRSFPGLYQSIPFLDYAKVHVRTCIFQYRYYNHYVQVCV